MQLPSEIPILVLPTAVLFPQSILPLYIFEPRYREMLKQALENQRVFAVSLANANGKPHEVAGLGLIRACVDRPDGTSHLLLQGIARIRFEEFTQEKPFYQGRAHTLKTEEAESVQAQALATKLVEVLSRQNALNQGPGHDVVPFLRQLDDPEALADIVATHFIESIIARQDLLETSSLPERLHKLLVTLHAEKHSPENSGN